MRIPLGIKSSRGRSTQLSAERLVNLFAEAAPEGAKAPVYVRGIPGLKSFADAGSGPIRGMIRLDGLLYVIAGSQFCSVSANGAVTELGSIPGSGSVFMSHNGTQIVITDGSNDYMDGYFLFSGVSWGYIYTRTDGLRRITDPDFPPTASPNMFFISDLLDGQVYDALDYASAESYPDPLMRVFRDHQEVLMFGAESLEVWHNAGNADFPFAPIKGASAELGLGAANTVQKLDNSVVWLANDGTVRRAGEGWTPMRISDHAVEYVIGKSRADGTMKNASSWTYAQEGHEFYVLTIPGQGTWVYDAATQLWHERQSYGLNRYRAEHYCHCYNKHLVGDYETGQIYELSLDTQAELDRPIVAELTFPQVQADGRRLIVDRFELDCEKGVGLSSGQGSSPQYMLSISADGGETFSDDLWISPGNIGQFQAKTEWRRLGQYRSFTPRVRISDPVKRAIYTAYLDARPCNS